MAMSIRKLKDYLGLTEDEGAELSQTPTPSRPSPVAAPKKLAVAPTPIHQQQLPMNPMQNMDRIVTITPRVYSEARAIGEFYREGNPVIMNLSDMEESERRRLIDFASGLVFGHAGTIERVTSKVFLLTPPNVSVSSEEKSAAAEASFFNQS